MQREGNGKSKNKIYEIEKGEERNIENNNKKLAL